MLRLRSNLILNHISVSFFTFLEYNASRAGSDGSRRRAVRWLCENSQMRSLSKGSDAVFFNTHSCLTDRWLSGCSLWRSDYDIIGICVSWCWKDHIFLVPCIMEAKYDPINSEERQMVSAVHRWDESKEHVERKTGQEHPSHLNWI